MEKITYTNANNESIVIFGSPYYLTKIQGIENPNSNLQTETAPYTDGEQMLDLLYEKRQITVEFNLLGSYSQNAEYRRIVSKTFRRIYDSDGNISQGTITYQNDYGSYEIDAVVDSMSASEIDNSSYIKYQIIFSCVNPFLRDINETSVNITNESGGFEFPLDIPAEGYEFSALNSIQEINCKSDVETPILIYFYGASTNPCVKNNTTGQKIKINKTLSSGDVLIINTTPCKKSITLISGGIESSAYNYITADTQLFQLIPGINELEYTSDDVDIDAVVVVTYKQLYLGA